jgi:hypothetical protein
MHNADSAAPRTPLDGDSQGMREWSWVHRDRWLCWYGKATERYWAVPRYGRPLLVEAGSADELIIEIMHADAERGWEPLAENRSTHTVVSRPPSHPPQ